jgi:hypothetical protein
MLGVEAETLGKEKGGEVTRFKNLWTRDEQKTPISLISFPPCSHIFFPSRIFQQNRNLLIDLPSLPSNLGQPFVFVE